MLNNVNIEINISENGDIITYLDTNTGHVVFRGPIKDIQSICLRTLKLLNVSKLHINEDDFIIIRKNGDQELLFMNE